MNEIELNHTPPITQAIFYAMELVGFKPLNIDKHSLEVIITNIRENQKDISINEFRKAFELGANGKLDIDLNTYQNFNTLYISNVLSAYRRYKIAGNQKESFKLPAPENFKEWGMEEKKRHFIWLRDEIFLKTSKRNGRSGEFPKYISASFKDIYDYMVSDRMINEIMGNELKDRISEALRMEKLSKKNIGNAISVARSERFKKEDDIPPCFYKLEVTEYFNNNLK